MTSHFVTFFSPGTFVPESTEKPIEAWDPAVAMAMAGAIRERYGATPYGFRFTTRTRADHELDSRVTATSHMYYLGGKIATLADVKVSDPGSILLSNMECNGIDRVLINTNSWKVVLEFRPEDVVLDWVQP